MVPMTTTRPLPGDFGLAPGGGWAMAVVRWGTGVPRIKHGHFIRRPARYGHAAVCVGWDDAANQPVIVEATPGGVVRRTVALNHFDWSTDGPLTPQLTPAVRETITRSADALVGEPYDWPNIGKFLIRWAAPSFTGRTEPDAGDGHVICSELVVWAYRRGHVAGMLDSSAPGNVAPNDLLPFLGPFRPKTGSRA